MPKRFLSKNLFDFIEGIIFSSLLIWFSTGLRILSPTYVGWLQHGDGTMEIAWEFFRKQPILQFPLGLNPQYGLEISSTMAFDGQIPLLSLLFKPFSFILPERFQYVGIFLLICFILNYVVAKRIFRALKLNNFNACIAAIIISTSPIILCRFVDRDHYGLTAAFLIFYAIYLVVTPKSSIWKWVALYLISILIFIYYTVFIFVIHVIFMAFRVFFQKYNLCLVTFNLFLIAASCLVLMYTVGFFYGNVASSDIGFGLFRATLTSPIDSSNWSNILPDLSEFDGTYEGFAYIGLSSMNLLIILVLIKKKKVQDNFLDPNLFRVLWLASILLFIFSLSNKIALGTFEIFDYPIPTDLIPYFSVFRSSGRFAWLFVFVLFFWLVYRISLSLDTKSLSTILVLLLSLHLIDINGQLSSQKKNKFSTSYLSNLNNPAWNEINNCYKNIRVYPPTVGVDNSYNFINLANNLDLGINTVRFGRLDNKAINNSFELIHQEFNTGIYRNDSFYIFTESEFVSSDVVDFHKNMAIRTLGRDSAYGTLNGYTFLAPNLNNCKTTNLLKLQTTRFGVPDEQKYKGQLIEFDDARIADYFVLTGFSSVEKMAIWSLGESSRITMNTSNLKNFSVINIEGMDFATPLNTIEVFLNTNKIGNCVYEVNLSICSIPFNFNSQVNSVINLEFRPKLIRSPKLLNISEDTRSIGFGLKSLSFS